MKRTVESLTPPENKYVMWLDVSGKIKQLKTYINGEWVIVNDDTENNKEIVKTVLESIDKDFESYIKKEDADSKYVQQEVLDRDYVKSEYATKTYATIKELNNLSTSLDSDYVKKAYADATYVTKSTLEDYVTITDADTKYVSTETLNSYITADAISEIYATKDAIKDFITTTTAESTYAKITSLSNYIKSVDVENNYVSKTDTSYVKTDTLDNYVTIETANSIYATQTALAGKVAQETYDVKMATIDSKLETLENKTIDVDAELKDSPNPVQNRAVNAAVLNLNTEIGKKADTTALNSAVGRITALENNGATGVTVTESGEGNGIASIKNVGKNIIATKATFVTSLTGYVTTDTLNTELAKKSDVDHNHDTKYAAKEHTHPEYAQSSALNDYVTKTALDGKNFLTATSLNGYVNEVQPDGTQSGNGIANITKEGKVLKVTKSTFLTEHQSLADYATKTWVNEQGFAKGTIPTKTSELENDSGFLTQHQSLADYATQAWVRQNAATQEWVKSQNYLTANDLQETIKITLVSTKSTSDAALRGAKITVKNGSSTIGTYTWQGSVISLKVASGLEVTVSVSDVTGYKTPAEQKFMTAMSNIREVKMEYKEQKLGVYILETDGTMTEPTIWNKDNNSTVLGVYVGGENCSLVLAPEGTTARWSNATKIIPGVRNEDSGDAPTDDFDGIGNTEKIIKTLVSETYNAAKYCNQYEFKNGKKGYFFALGEALVVYTNLEKVKQAYSALGNTTVYEALSSGLLTSNQQGSTKAWAVGIVSSKALVTKSDSLLVIPVCQY